MIFVTSITPIVLGRKHQHRASRVSTNEDQFFGSHYIVFPIMYYGNSFLNLSAAEAALLFVGSRTRAYLKSSIASL